HAFAAPALPALRRLQPAIAALTPLARRLAPTSGALAGAFGRLTPQLPRVDRATAKVVPCELAVQKFFAWTLSVLKMGDKETRASAPRGTIVGGSDQLNQARNPTLEPTTGCAGGR